MREAVLDRVEEPGDQCEVGGRAGRRCCSWLGGLAGLGTGDMTVTDREAEGHTFTDRALAGDRAGFCSDSRVSHTTQ